MNWRALLTLLLVAGAAASGWALWSQRAPQAATPEPGGMPDYVLNDFELVALNAEGRESFTLEAPRLARDPGVRSMDIETPVFTIPDSSAQDRTTGTWVVKSKTGWISADGDELRLRGDVRADSTGGGKPLAMRSQELNVFPETERATSAVEVTVTEPGFILTGHNLEADLASGNIRLQDSKARYERTPR
ncbi:LPS export ABC transporter periplasmic protein LptC [Lysobacter sp. A3-1-A15]|uniref:LPS export ABC transporter periplasmic protein LptC n=1 Tax=Novilysobacter viscosus TaxID=3098602 RepID=UPI002EDB6C5D